MTTAIHKVAILTSGGDAPGMNAAIRSATRMGEALGIEVYGISRGYRGLLEEKFFRLRSKEISQIFRDGGTLLHSTRCLEFHETATRHRARKILTEREIGGVIVIGGNGSLAGALALGSREGGDYAPPAVIGIPASIDNDIGSTSMCIGVDTAINTIVEACDKISDTASAHDRCFIVEVMGRDCGYLAMTAGIASGADLVLVPEAHRSPEDIVLAALHTVQQGSNTGLPGSTLIIKAEGVSIGTNELKEQLDRQIELQMEGLELETRVTVLGHVVRGGRPSAFDRLLGARMGNSAMRSIAAGDTNKMISWRPLSEQTYKPSASDPCCWLVNLSEALQTAEQTQQSTLIGLEPGVQH